MAVIRPFRALRPAPGREEITAALPYDVYKEREARAYCETHPASFLTLDCPETHFPEGTDPSAPEVMRYARELFEARKADGAFIREEKPCLYTYSLTMDGRTQTGLVACSSVDDYRNNVILKHENTLREKEENRRLHVGALSAQTGPIFLAYRDNDRTRALMDEAQKAELLCDFVSEDGIRHAVRRISDPELIRELTEAFGALPHTYIADGHHRAASAVRVAVARREAAKACTPDVSGTAETGMAGADAIPEGKSPKVGTAEYDFFLSVLFPARELRIFDYNRVVKDLNGLSPEMFLEALKTAFLVTYVSEEGNPYRPAKKGEIGLFLNKKWYKLNAKPEILSEDPREGLDVSLLQRYVLDPILGIRDPKTDRRIDFVGGIRGLSELERRVNEDMAAAFAMFPTQMDELFAVADAGCEMPPKSTWFEPKLRSGLLIHEFER